MSDSPDTAGPKLDHEPIGQFAKGNRVPRSAATLPRRCSVTKRV